MSAHAAERRTILPFLLLCAAALALPACGKKGPNQPPIRILPAPAQGLSVRQIGPDVLLTARLSLQETDGTPIGDKARLRILRMRATDTLKPGSVSQRYLLQEFERGAQVVATLGGEALALAAPGGRLTFRDTGALSAAPAGARPRFMYGVVIVDGQGKRSPLPPPPLIEVVPAPPAPHDLKLETGEGEIRLRWEPGGPGAPATLFNIYRRTKADAEDPEAPLNHAPIEATTYTDKEFNYGETYRYVVRALASKEAPPRESPDSPEVEVLPRDIYPPQAPTGLAAAAEGTIIRVYWFPNNEPDLAGYRIYRRDAPDAEFKLLAEVGAADTTYADAAVRPGVRYHYVVTAVDSASPPNESARSEERTETLPAYAAPPGPRSQASPSPRPGRPR